MSLFASRTASFETDFMAHENWQQVKEIFAEALRQTPEARSEFLDSACRDDKKLRREIESLLSSFDSAESFMESPAVGGYANDKVLTESRKFDKGQILGHYEIIRQIGKGGMGDVYLAQDTKLDRRVALKILHENLMWQSQAKQRLLREARAVAKLDHPNICAIYEISESDDCSFIVMQYVSGETLADILLKERLSAETSCNLALQIAAALEEAHSHNIIHRDIKPANIIVGSKGQLKILDFGLAKIIEAQPDEKATQKLSSSGAIMGTVPYMSPEQLRGKRLDARTDIFSFGVLFYEMLSGISPFQNDSNAETISAILNDEPDLTRIPSELQSIVQKCLAKEKNERYQTAKDLLFDLKNLPPDSIENISFEADAERNSKTVQELNFSTDDRLTQITKDEETVPQIMPQTKNQRWIWTVSMLAILFAGFAGWSWWRSNQAETNLPAPLSVSQFVNWKRDLNEDPEASARFSPDGKLVAFASTRSGIRAIWLKQVSGGEEFTHKQDRWEDRNPIFSPDGQEIAFISQRDGQNGVWSMPTLGGTSILLKTLEGTDQNLLKWSKDGATIYFDYGKNVFALDSASKQITKLTDLDSWQTAQIKFDISPDEERIAFIAKENEQSDIWVVSKDGGQPVRITNDEFVEGYLVWHPDGQRIIYDSVRNGISQIFAVRLDGNLPEQLIFSDNSNYISDVSPDGKQILYNSQQDDADIWKVALDNSNETRLTENIGVEIWADPAPDGKTFVFQAERTADVRRRIVNASILTQTIGGDNQSLQLAEDGYLPRWSPDGKQMAFLRSENGLTNLWTVPSIGGEAKPLTADGVTFGGYSLLPFNRVQTQDYQWSPDGRSLIYCSRRGNVSNLWQTMADGSSENQLTKNTNVGKWFFSPMMSPEGQRIAVLELDLSATEQKGRKWSVWIYEADKTKMVFQSESMLDIVGWSATGSEIIVKTLKNGKHASPFPADVDLIQISLHNGATRPLLQLSTAYLKNISLSPDGQTIAFVARKDGTDSIHIVSIKSGADRTVLISNDPRVFFASLAWSPDGKSIYFGKQSNRQIISMIENFK
jgi:serine/threonine protein kinase/Tol biopolymer transport system component